MKKRLLLIVAGGALAVGGYLVGRRPQSEVVHADSAIPAAFGNPVAAYTLGGEVWFVMENSSAEIRSVRISDGHVTRQR
jgi:hypothetical protein